MQSYFEKYGFGNYSINGSFQANSFLSIVIPCFNEPDLPTTLNSLFNCNDTINPVEVIIVINSPDNASTDVLLQNAKTLNDTSGWIQSHQKENLRFHVLMAANLPAKHAGVGLARKIGMDCAAFQFNGIGKHEGVIVCLDADCTVSKNYLTEIENHFTQNKKSTGCSIYFEHKLEGNLSEWHYKAITDYELFLRYYRQALYYTGFPYHFHTIGSSMAVRNSVYQKQGGMNKRKAGEDFYFLHKVFPLGNFTEVNTACVYPSARESMRVPFGTGSAVTKILKERTDAFSNSFSSYNFKIFTDLQLFFNSVPQFYSLKEDKILSHIKSLPASIQSYLADQSVAEKIAELQNNSASTHQFINRFYRWFDGFRVLKFVHFARDHFYANENIEACCNRLLEKTGKQNTGNFNKKELLDWMRNLDRNLSIS